MAGDTHVVLKASDGSTLEYVIFSVPSRTKLNNEISLEEAQQLGLVGLRVGDAFVQNPGAFFERSFTVEKVQSALTYAFQDDIANYGKRFPTAPFFVTGFTLKTEPPSVADFQPLIDSAHDRERRQKAILETYREKALPLDFTARMAQVDVSILMGQLGTPDGDHLLVVEFYDDQGVQLSRAAARDAKRVVLTRSALFTIEAFALRDRIPGFEWIAPRSLRDQLEAELDEANRKVREGESLLGTGGRGLQVTELAPNDPYLVNRLDAISNLLKWFDLNVTVLARPLDAFGAPTGISAENRSVLGDPAVDAIELALHTPATLYADDLGLRRLALQLKAPSLSTVSLLQVLAERGDITADERDRLLLTLLEHHYHVIRPTPELLVAATKPDCSVTVRRRAFQTLGTGGLTLGQAAEVLTRSIRLAALEPIATTTTEEIARLGLTALATAFGVLPSVQLVMRSAESELALLPEQLQITRVACLRFRRTRA